MSIADKSGYLTPEDREQRVKKLFRGTKMQKFLLFLTFLCTTIFVAHYDNYLGNARVHDEYYMVFFIMVIPVVFFPKIVLTAFNLSIVMMLLFNMYHYFGNEFEGITTGILAVILIPVFALSTIILYANHWSRKKYKEAEAQIDENARNHYANTVPRWEMDTALSGVGRKSTMIGIFAPFFIYWFCYSFLTDWIVMGANFFK